jgi:hypothetical protein
VPLIGLAADWQLQWHSYRRWLRCVDLILTDIAGVEGLARESIRHACAANLFGCPPGFVDAPWPEGPRDIDIYFAGNFRPAVQRERLPWLGRLARLGERWRVQIDTGVLVSITARRWAGRASLSTAVRAARRTCAFCGFPAGCNQGLACGRYIVFLNNDTVIPQAGWLEHLIGCVLHQWPQVAMVGAISNYTAAPQQVLIDYHSQTEMEAFSARRRKEFAGPGRPAGSGHDHHQHGGPMHRHQAGTRGRRGGRPARAGNGAARRAADRPPTGGAGRTAGRSGERAVLPVAGG